jgi:hypothetical protein
VPAQSSAEAEVRGASSCARELIFVKQLLEEDFGLELETPKPWLDSTAAIQSQKKLGQGSKPRHMEIGELYCQELVRSNQITLGKIPGTKNPANVLTKHVSAQELQSQLENLDMCDLDRHPELRSQLDNAEALYIASVLSAADDVSNRSLPRLAGLKEQKDNSITMPWKPKYTAAVSALQLVAADVLLTPAKAQGGANGSSEVVKFDDHSLL